MSLLHKGCIHLNFVNLEPLNDKNTFLELARKLWNKYERDATRSAFGMYLRSFQMTQSFLPEIWDRLLVDVRLEQDYWGVESRIHDAERDGEDYTLTEGEKKVLEEFSAHRERSSLDIEDWFIHAHVLLEKYAILFKLALMLSNKDSKEIEKIKSKSLHQHLNFFRVCHKGILDEGYTSITEDCSKWYFSEVKDVRDDLIIHEKIGRFWGSSTFRDSFSFSRFNSPDSLVAPLYSLRDKYKKGNPIIENEENVFNLLTFFESNASRIEPTDLEKVKRIRKNYGRPFPDIPELYKKMNAFFSTVNDYLMPRT